MSSQGRDFRNVDSLMRAGRYGSSTSTRRQCMHALTTAPRSPQDYDSYSICLGKGFWPHEELIDPSTGMLFTEGEQNLTAPELLAFTWRSAKQNDLPTYVHARRSHRWPLMATDDH